MNVALVVQHVMTACQEDQGNVTEGNLMVATRRTASVIKVSGHGCMCSDTFKKANFQLHSNNYSA